MELESYFAEVNGINLHYVAAGAGEPIIMLHGFPAFWYVWKRQLEHFGRSFRVIAPDGRGVNLSSKPENVSDYHIDMLVDDVIALADHLELSTFTLVGHDWGGTVAWAVARRSPQRVKRLIVMNAPPLEAFLYALTAFAVQRTQSTYMTRLKAPDTELSLLASNCELLWQVSFARHQSEGIYDEGDRAQYIEAWQREGAVTGFLNWYRANVPDFDTLNPALFEAHRIQPIDVPALLLWGMHEKAFTPELLALIPHYVKQVEIVHVPHADHWVMLENSAFIEKCIADFLTSS